jgi:hypothetical protein
MILRFLAPQNKKAPAFTQETFYVMKQILLISQDPS